MLVGSHYLSVAIAGLATTIWMVIPSARLTILTCRTFCLGWANATPSVWITNMPRLLAWKAFYTKK